MRNLGFPRVTIIGESDDSGLPEGVSEEESGPKTDGQRVKNGRRDGIGPRKTEATLFLGRNPVRDHFGPGMSPQCYI